MNMLLSDSQITVWDNTLEFQTISKKINVTQSS